MSMQRNVKRPCRFIVEIIAVLVILAATGVQGRQALRTWQSVCATGHILLPGLMWATGHGYRAIVETDEIRAFTTGGKPTFEVDAESLQFIEFSHFQKTHLYMTITAGVLWRCFGPHWHVIKCFILFLLFVSVIMLYLICRLCMGRFLSVIVTLFFISSPLVMGHLESLRDFSKTPFYFGSFLLLGILLRLQIKPRHLMAIALGLALLLGIGMGFRRDMLVMVVITIPMLVACPGRQISIMHRTVAFCAYLGVLLLLTLPIIALSPKERGQDSIRVICGFSSEYEAPLELAATSYMKQPAIYGNTADAYALTVAQSAASTGVTVATEEFEKRRRAPSFEEVYTTAYLYKTMRIFPADLVVRAFSSVKKTLVGLETPIPLIAPLLNATPWATVLLLLGVAAWSPWRATFFLYLLLTCCGYMSLQFQIRHAFHLYFVPFLIWGALFHGGIRVITSLFSDKVRSLLLVKRFFKRVAIAITWALVILVLGGGAMVAILSIQYHTLNHMRASLLQAERVPVKPSVSAWDERILLRLNHLDCAGASIDFDLATIRTALYMIHFEYHEKPIAVGVSYTGYPWYSYAIQAALKNVDKGDDLYLFVPVFESVDNHYYNIFNGFVVDEEVCEQIQGIYYLEPTGHYPLTLLTTETPGHLVFYQRPAWLKTEARKVLSGNNKNLQDHSIPPSETPTLSQTEICLVELYRHRPESLYRRLHTISLRIQQGNDDGALNMAGELMDAFSRNQLLMRHIFLRWEQDSARPALWLWGDLCHGRLDNPHLTDAVKYALTDDKDSIHMFLETFHQQPDILQAYLDAIELHGNETIRRLSFIWLADFHMNACNYSLAEHYYRRIIALGTQDGMHFVKLGHALNALGNHAAALEAYRDVILRYPESPNTANAIDAIYRDFEDLEGRLEMWRTLTAARPESSVPWLHLGIALQEAALLDKALACYEKAVQFDGDNANAHRYLGTLEILSGNIEKGEAALEMGLANDSLGAVEVINTYGELAIHFLDAGDYALSERYYRKTIALNTQDGAHYAGLGHALRLKRAFDAALEAYRDVLLRYPESPTTAEAIDAIYYERGDTQGRLEMWRNLTTARPDTAVPWLHLGMILEETHENHLAIEAYRHALKNNPGLEAAQTRLDRLLLSHEEPV